MRPPELEPFKSVETGQHGRTYEVWQDTRLVAFAIDHRGALPCPGPVYVFTVTRGQRVGYWNWTSDPEDLRRVMETMVAGLDPEAPKPDPGEYTIRPQYNRELEHRLHQDALEAPLPRIDLAELFEGEAESEARVIRLHRDDDDED